MLSTSDGVGRYYDPQTGQFLTLDPLVDETGAPYAYVGGDPVNELDPYGLGGGPFGIDLNPVDAVSGAYHSAVKLGNAALPYIHDASAVIAIGASYCAAAGAETVILGVGCGTIALGAGAVDLGTGAILNHEGKESNTAVVFDAAGFGLSGIGTGLELAAKTADELSAAARGMSALRLAQAQSAPWYAKAGPWIASQWWAFKGSVWADVATNLSTAARAAAAGSLGAGAAGSLWDIGGPSCPT